MAERPSAGPTRALRGRGGDRSRSARSRTPLSRDAVVAEAVALLDQSGEGALTFRALAARLGGGLGSIYWYVSGKDELLDRATDRVVGDVLTATELIAGSADPIDDIRDIAVELFDAVVARPWLARYFLRDTALQPNSLLLYERLGQQVLRLGLRPQAAFDSVSAVVGYVVGVAADLAQEPPAPIVDGRTTREAYLHDAVERWRSLDPAEYPFLHTILDVFEGHDDTEQFRAGLEMLLAGLRMQTSPAAEAARLEA